MKNTKKKKHWLAKNPVLLWAIISAIFAVIIHVLYSFPAPSKFFAAKWGAGELLAYSSTVAIGLLALWQNNRFKEENDIAQSRLEKLSVQSNTLSVINKIIEIENDNLSRLRIALDTFSAACSPEEIAASLYSASKGIDQPGDIQVAMAVQEKRIDDSFFALARELRIDPNIHKCPTDSFSKVMGAFYMAAKDVVGDYRQNRNQKPLYKAEALAHLRLEFLSERERLLARKEKMLNNVIFGHFSLDEIKNMYHAEYAKQDLPQAERTEME